jgi:hypothetical protein
MLMRSDEVTARATRSEEVNMCFDDEVTVMCPDRVVHHALSARHHASDDVHQEELP